MENQFKSVKRCIIEFYGEPKNLIKRFRVKVYINNNDVPFWEIPKRYMQLFNETAVFLCYNREWLISSALSRGNLVAFLYPAPWEKTRKYFKGE